MKRKHPKASAASERVKPTGVNTFSIAIKAIIRKGSLNQGLSYFYVDHIDLISELKLMIERLGGFILVIVCHDH